MSYCPMKIRLTIFLSCLLTEQRTKKQGHKKVPVKYLVMEKNVKLIFFPAAVFSGNKDKQRTMLITPKLTIFCCFTQETETARKK